MTRTDHARDVKHSLTDPVQLCERLGLAKGAKRQAKGLVILCPAHDEKTPSCSVTVAPDGTIRVRCFGCEWGGDALSLIAIVHGLDTRSEFVEVLAIGAELGGLHSLSEDLRQGRPARAYEPPQRPEPGPEADYPDEAEVIALWESAGSVTEDRDASGVLAFRAIDPDAVADRRLARVIPERGKRLPAWARYGGRYWSETGHRMILRMFDADGRVRSVRAWRIIEAATPKRLPPVGCRTSELVLANRPAVAMLMGRAHPNDLIVVEGEPDFLTTAVRHDQAIVGLISGSWTDEFARRVPQGTRVFLWTHHDQAGDRYAARVRESLEKKCPIWRAA